MFFRSLHSHKLCCFQLLGNNCVSLRCPRALQNNFVLCQKACILGENILNRPNSLVRVRIHTGISPWSSQTSHSSVLTGSPKKQQLSDEDTVKVTSSSLLPACGEGRWPAASGGHRSWSEWILGAALGSGEGSGQCHLPTL